MNTRQILDRTILFDLCRRDAADARDTAVAIVAASLVFGLVLIASAILGA